MPAASLATRLGRANGPTPPTERACAHCAGAFTSARATQRYCSALCTNRAAKRRAYNAGSRRKFPRIRYTQRRAVLERDGWRCQLCRAVIDPALRFPHPGSASIDHIDPFGAHEQANWQSAHLACNVAKGARAA